MKNIYLIIILLLLSTGCTKEYLEKRPNKALLVPETLDDFQKLLDASFDANLNTVTGLNEIAADNFQADEPTLRSLDVIERNSYLWSQDIYEGNSVNDWNFLYQEVFVSNVVLSGLQKLDEKVNASQYNAIKGTALYYRAEAFYSLAQMFAVPYNAATATILSGIPIRTDPDVNQILSRGTLQQSYDRILADLQEAARLLPANVHVKIRPTNIAALGMLARVSITMGRYAEAFNYADQALHQNGTLIDYNTLTPTGSDSPFPMILPFGNEEVLCYNNLVGYSFFLEPLVLIDPQLYQSYADDDLRKTCYFADQGNGGFNYIGSYSGTYATLFGGPATDELYLIRSECSARLGNMVQALNDLNALLVKRWKAGTYRPVTISEAEKLLGIILTERRKELVGRGLRWTDLRRLNQDPRFATTLTRNYEGKTLTLAPEDKRYTFPIPMDEITRSGIEQNDR
ncbi:RagB/SusD family nutrient uptake outer membrane protein [Mucilaginibacter sp. CSA2-8R]|uniref:RagB/SusD family nutrient uptake outer membrane protein n=1 Tax=Mucilaginibacter sp. CSA2-8R TaxID=3141542 RepID=UPI00315DA82A